MKNTILTIAVLFGFHLAHAMTPTECYWKGKGISDKNAAILCSGATDASPIDCYWKASSISNECAALLYSNNGKLAAGACALKANSEED